MPCGGVVGTLNFGVHKQGRSLQGFFWGPITPLITGRFPPSELGKIYEVPHKIFTTQPKTLEIRSKFPKNCNPFMVGVRSGTPKMTGIPSQPSAPLVVFGHHILSQENPLLKQLNESGRTVWI